MIFGDPEKFAIWFDRVEAWAYEDFDNGILFYLTNWKLIGREVKFPTLASDMYNLGFKIRCVEAQKVDVRLQNLPTDEAYEEIYNRTFAIGLEENDSSFWISTTSQSDLGEEIFLLKTSDEFDRLLFGFGPDGKLAKETKLPKGEVLAVLREAVEWYKQSKSVPLSRPNNQSKQ